IKGLKFSPENAPMVECLANGWQALADVWRKKGGDAGDMIRELYTLETSLLGLQTRQLLKHLGEFGLLRTLEDNHATLWDVWKISGNADLQLGEDAVHQRAFHCHHLAIMA